MKKRPNIVFILSDDQGSWAAGCYGNKDVQTPHLDRLAEEGMKFNNYFCTSPVCSPARASLLTGKIPSQHGVHDWIREGNTGPNSIEYLKGQRAYTEILAENGYVCGISGKWHLGDSFQPQKGFTHWYVLQAGGSDYYGAPVVKNGQSVIESEYITHKITEDAISFIKEHGNQEHPFYISVHYTAPHSPWVNQHPTYYMDMYEHCSLDNLENDAIHPWVLRSTVPDSVYDNPKIHLQGYYASITAMDDCIGRIVRQLEELGIRNDTLICFMSDNGFNCGQHGFWGKGNGTFPQNMYDTSIKIPAIMSHPGRIPANQAIDTLLSGYDFMPTLLDYLELSSFTPEQLPGRSFLPILQGEKLEDDHFLVIYDEYGPVRMIRSKDWKYIHRYPYGPHELYDLVNDPSEQMNLYSPDKDHPYASKISELKSQLDEWYKEYVQVERDGVKEPVIGKGQTGLAGISAKGGISFNQRMDEDVGDQSLYKLNIS